MPDILDLIRAYGTAVVWLPPWESSEVPRPRIYRWIFQLLDGPCDVGPA